MADGIQETVRLGLLILAKNVEAGKYGYGDDAFTGEDGDPDDLSQQFLNDVHDEVLDKMQ